MRIAIDARSHGWAGIGRYIRNLLEQLAKIPHGHDVTVILTPEQAPIYRGPFKTVTVDGSYYSWREQVVVWRQLQRIEADVWHFTHFNVPWFFNRPFIVTIHDVTRFIFPGQKRQHLLQQVAYEALLARSIRRAQHVIAVSHSTARALRELPLTRNARETVIYEGVEEKFFANIPDLSTTKIAMLLGTNQPYLLYVGVWMTHKNLERLMHAVARVRRRYPDVRLVMTGKPVPGYADMIEVARRLKMEEAVIFPGFVPDELLPALYAGASCFVFPSLYEGFGLPVLEAAAAGVPVVTSNVTSTAELMRGAALLVNPESISSITAGIEQVLGNPTLAGRLQALGRARAANFTWEKAVAEHLFVYEHLGL